MEHTTDTTRPRGDTHGTIPEVAVTMRVNGKSEQGSATGPRMSSRSPRPGWRWWSRMG